MGRTSVLTALVFGFLLQPAALMGQSGMGNAKPIDPQLRADILHLIEITHSIQQACESARASAQWVKPRLMAALPATSNREKIAADYAKRVESIPESPEFVNGLVAIYAKYFSDDDVKALTGFYSTPAGRRFNKHAMQVQNDSMQLGQQVVSDKLIGVFEAVCSDYPELRGQAKFCGFAQASNVEQDPK